MQTNTRQRAALYAISEMLKGKVQPHCTYQELFRTGIFDSKAQATSILRGLEGLGLITYSSGIILMKDKGRQLLAELDSADISKAPAEDPVYQIGARK